jgi:drug/metabolite transporter (DMT)-like permease
LGTLWFTTALLKVNFISFSVVFLLQKLQPIFAITAAHFFLKEKITTSYIKWALLAFISAYFVTFPNGNINLDSGPETLIAALFALAAAAAWGSSTAISRLVLTQHSNTVITVLRFILTSALALIAVIVLGQTNSLPLPTLPQINTLIVIALTTGMAALWIYYKGLKHTQAKVSTILELIFPATAVLIDVFVYKTFLVPTQYLAALVLLFTIYRTSKLNQST